MRVIARRTEEGFLIPFCGNLKNIQADEVELYVLLIKRSFTEELRKTLKKNPNRKIDFKEEWHKYLEEKYCG
ncbi:hypothetical protein [Thermosulfurimonas sp. F29]|uniref:hypothetical protein n=1 Tax=Thermosulfurimonas sp. F29 TaxID=2867247 RepID=UPI001C83E703|nr:hypothetical protein [Thermosulfurimonas sp. F29]MBX6423462.1 hypothetical protein [Thermosulfurimonas sp. F29]